jgi:hypothetical protein
MISQSCHTQQGILMPEAVLECLHQYEELHHIPLQALNQHSMVVHPQERRAMMCELGALEILVSAVNYETDLSVC